MPKVKPLGKLEQAKERANKKAEYYDRNFKYLMDDYQKKRNLTDEEMGALLRVCGRQWQNIKDEPSKMTRERSRIVCEFLEFSPEDMKLILG